MIQFNSLKSYWASLFIISYLPLQPQEYQKIAKELRDFYFGDAAIDETTLEQYIKLLSDLNFIYGIDKAAKRHASKTDSNTYYLRYSRRLSIC